MLTKSKSIMVFVLVGVALALFAWLYTWQEDNEADLDGQNVVEVRDGNDARRTGVGGMPVLALGVVSGSFVNSRGESVTGTLTFSIEPPPGARGDLVETRQENILVGRQGTFVSPPLGYCLINMVMKPVAGVNFKRSFLKLPGVDLDLGQVLITSGGRVAGTVTDEAGDPVVGALVLVGAQGRRVGKKGVGVFMVGIDHDSTQEALTKSDGCFDISGVSTGRVVLIVTASGFTPQTITNIVLKENGEESVEVELYRARTLTVEVREQGSGVLLSGVRIELDALDYAPGDQVLQEFNHVSKATGNSGAVAISGLAQRRYRLRVHASGYIVPKDIMVGKNETLVAVQLDKNGEVFGRVFDTKNGQSIGDFELSTRYLRRRAKGRDFEIVTGETAAKYFQKPDDKGMYGLRLGQHPSVRISVQAPGFAGGSIEIEDLSAGEVRHADIGLVSESILEGMILSHDYKPLSEAQVTATLYDDQSDDDDAAERAVMTGNIASVDPLNGMNRFFPRETTTVMTDVDGYFRLTGLSAGRYRVSARHPRQEDSTPAEYVLEARQHLKDIEIQLRPAGGVRGQVFDENGKAVPGAVVSVRTALPSGASQGIASLALTEEVKVVTADQNGVFVLTGIKPGSYSLLATGPDLVQQGRTHTLAVQVSIRIRPGVDLEKRLQFQTQ